MTYYSKLQKKKQQQQQKQQYIKQFSNWIEIVFLSHVNSILLTNMRKIRWATRILGQVDSLLHFRHWWPTQHTRNHPALLRQECSHAWKTKLPGKPHHLHTPGPYTIPHKRINFFLLKWLWVYISFITWEVIAINRFKNVYGYKQTSKQYINLHQKASPKQAVIIINTRDKPEPQPQTGRE